jgi:hypothetical protein
VPGWQRAGPWIQWQFGGPCHAVARPFSPTTR